MSVPTLMDPHAGIISVTADPALRRALEVSAPERVGALASIVGLSIDITGISGAVGDLVSIETDNDEPTVAEVVAITPHTLRCMPLGAVHGLRVGMQARATGRPLMTPTGPQLLGRVLDGRKTGRAELILVVLVVLGHFLDPRHDTGIHKQVVALSARGTQAQVHGRGTANAVGAHDFTAARMALAMVCAAWKLVNRV